MDFTQWRVRNPNLPYVLPFGVFILFLALQNYNPLPPAIEFPVRLAVLTALLWVFSRDVIDFKSRQLLASVGLGLAVFILWILPGELFPHYRESPLFQNALTGSLQSSLSNDSKMDPLILILRSVRAVLLVPVIEELFWRAWLMRWLISPRFEDVRLGTYNTQAFWLTAILFGSEHGPFWDVGIASGVIYNWWMVRTRSLGDCILAHAVTNAALCGYVIAKQRWEYWM